MLNSLRAGRISYCFKTSKLQHAYQLKRLPDDYLIMSRVLTTSKIERKRFFFSAEAKKESSRIRQSFDFCSNHQILQSTEEAEDPPNRDSKSSENNGNFSESLSTDTEVNKVF